jgi:hypothetical protein
MDLHSSVSRQIELPFCDDARITANITRAGALRYLESMLGPMHMAMRHRARIRGTCMDLVRAAMAAKTPDRLHVQEQTEHER